MTDDDAYLWDRSGPPDPEVEALERALAPLRARDAGPVARPPAAPVAVPRVLRGPRRWLPFAAAAAILVAGAVVLARHGPGGPTGRRLVVATADGATLEAGAWVTADATPREVVLGRRGRVTVRPGARVQLRAAGDDVARLYLATGAIEASIGADARPRWFQVDTDAGRCVDLGCRYVLTATGDGGAHVRVTSGQVAFEAGAREVFVPAGAEVTARAGRGPGTPRFSAAGPSLVDAVDEVDARPAGDPARWAAARRAVANAASDEDLLPIWHWLTDPDAAVATAALDGLVAARGAPPGWTPPRGRPGPADREAFREHLDRGW